MNPQVMSGENATLKGGNNKSGKNLLRMNMKDSIAGHVALSGETLRVNKPSSNVVIRTVMPFAFPPDGVGRQFCADCLFKTQSFLGPPEDIPYLGCPLTNLLAVPVLDASDTANAVIEVVNSKQGEFSKADAHLLQSFADFFSDHLESVQTALEQLLEDVTLPG